MLSLLLLISSTSLVPTVSSGGDRVRRGFEDTEGETIDESDCEPGAVVSGGDSCVPCIGGFYADTALNKCVECPFDKYSDGEANTECKACPNGKKTRDIGTHSLGLCTYDVCEIPETERAYYQLSKSSAYLASTTRVYAGDEIVLQCMDKDHKILNTEFSFLIITCTASFNAIPLPTTCANEHQPEEKSGLICYDSCYRERSGDETRFVKLVGGGKIAVESCPLVECQVGKDTCVTVSYTSENIKTVHYSCQASDLFDDEICLASGATSMITKKECSVKRCSTDRCNEPSTDSSSRTNGLSLLLIISSIALNLILSW